MSKNVMAFVRRSSFSLFGRMPTYLHRRKKASSFSSCSFRPFPCMMMSSATQTTPVRPSRSCSRRSWNISDDTLVLKGRRNYWYLPKRVWKVVSMLDSSSRITCQNPLAKSALVNTVEVLSSCRVSSRIGSVYLSRSRDLFSSLGSIHTQRAPDFFILIMSWPTHGV